MQDTNVIALLAVLAAGSLIPLLMIVSTSFLKISIVLMMARSALGVQQVPPNMAIYSVALAATIFVMAPVGYAISNNFQHSPIDTTQPGTQIEHQLEHNLSPLTDFMQRNTSPDMIEHMNAMAQRMWPPAMTQNMQQNSVFIILPSFVLSELQKGFEAGFLVYIPFTVIDLIVSNLLLALGMQMVSPMTISLPLKVLLFIMVSGWTHLLDSLFYSYH